MVHRAKQIQMLQGFINRVHRGIALNQGEGIREIQGKLTVTDLRLQVGIDHVEVYIADRTLGWIGHTARRGSERWEYKTLRVWLESESNWPTVGKKVSFDGRGKCKNGSQDWKNWDGGQDSWETLALDRGLQGRHEMERGKEMVRGGTAQEKDKDTQKRRHAQDARGPPVEASEDSYRR